MLLQFLLNHTNKLKIITLKKTFKNFKISTMRESVYFNKERSAGQLFSFHQKVLEPHSTKIYRLDQTVNIFKINTIRLHCNIISGSYVDNTTNHTLHEFGIMFRTLSIRVVVQNGIW